MRVLFTTSAGLGHFHPLVPLGQALKDKGHEVAFACPRSFMQVVEKSGFQAFSAGRDDASDPEVQATFSRAENVSREDFGIQFLLNVFVSANTRLIVPDLLAICQMWSPDLLVREETEFGAIIAAELRGLPHVSVQIGAGFSEATLKKMFPGLAEPNKCMSEKLDIIRQSYGLEPDPEVKMPYRHLALSFMPSSYHEPEEVAVAESLKLYPPIFDCSGYETLPAWVHSLPDRPTVYITLGSEANKIPGIYPGVLQTILAGLAAEPLNLIVTVGREQDPTALGPQGANVHIERYLPQSLILDKCDLVLMHGGTNTTQAALNFGLPMVIVPLFADQPYNAQRCEILKLGQVIEPEDLTPRTVQRAVLAVLNNPQYRQNVRRLQAEFRSLPGLEFGVSQLEKLVKSSKIMIS